MFQMARQNPDIIERQPMIRNYLKPPHHLRSDYPIGVEFDIDQMTDTDEAQLARSLVKYPFDFTRIGKRHPPDNTPYPVVRPSIGKQCLVFQQPVCRFDCHGAIDAGCLELRYEVVWMK